MPISGKGVHELNVAIEAKKPRQKSFTSPIGAVVVKVRKGKAFALKFDATRSFRHARRDMKRFVAGKKYADRPDLVQPTPDDAKHFETSS